MTVSRSSNSEVEYPLTVYLLGQIFHNAQWKSFKFASEKSIKEGAWKYDWVEKKASRRHYHIKVPEIVADPAS
jgi:hypothetical protein